MAGRHSQQELGTAKLSPRKFSEKIALLNKQEAEGNAKFEEIIKEVQATKRSTVVQPLATIAVAQTTIVSTDQNSTATVAELADDELEEVYQNLMSCQYDEDKDIVDSSSEVSSSARDQIEDIERSIREDTVAAPVVMADDRYAQAVIYTPKATPLLQQEDKFSEIYTPEQHYYRTRGTSVGSGGSIQQQPQEQPVVCYDWQVSQCTDYLKPTAPDRLQWQKSSSDPALNSNGHHKLSPSLQPNHQPNQLANSIHGSCSENYIQPETAQQTVTNAGCYNMLEQRQDLPGIKICAIEDLETPGEDQLGPPPVILHGGTDSELSTLSEKANSSLPDIAKLQFAPKTVKTEQQHSQWEPVRPNQMDFVDQQQQQHQHWIARTQVDMFEAKPVNSLLSNSDCGLQYNHLNQYTSSNYYNSSTPSRRHHHHHQHQHHHQPSSSSIHQQRLKAMSQDQIIRSHSHNNISYATKQRRQNCNQIAGSGSRAHLHHQHHYHLQHHQLHHQHQHKQPMSDYEHHMGRFGLQVGCPGHLEGAKSASNSNSSVRPQYGSISPINSPASQPTSPQSENQNSPVAVDSLGAADSYLPYSCSILPVGQSGGAPLDYQVCQPARDAEALQTSPFVVEQPLYQMGPCQEADVYQTRLEPE